MFWREFQTIPSSINRCKLVCELLFFFLACTPTVKQATLDTSNAELSVFGKCLSLANHECLKQQGWNFKKVGIEVVRDTLSTRTVPIFKKLKEQFLQSYNQGDHVYYFSYPNEYWQKGLGRDGYCIIRNDSLVAEIVLTLN